MAANTASRPSNRSTCAEEISTAVDHLAEDHGFLVVWELLDDATAGTYSGTSRTVTVNASATTEDQLWLIQEVQRLIVGGPDAAPDAEPVARLRLVPAQPADLN